MKPQAFDYVAPETLDQALDDVARGGEEARLLAGGQSLVPIMNLRLATPSLLIDLNGVPELSGIDARPDGGLRIGAMTRHRAVETSKLVGRRLPLLHAAMPFIAHVQIRNRGTVGGSLAHADPAAEWPALCLVLDAEMVARRTGGRRTIPAEAFSQGVMTTALDPGEILTDIHIPPAPPSRRWGFQEISRRRGDFALAGVVCTVDLAADDTVAASRIVVFGVADGPVRSTVASEILAGRRLETKLVREAGRAAAAAIDSRSDIHASSEYRAQLVETLTRRAVEQAANLGRFEDAA